MRLSQLTGHRSWLWVKEVKSVHQPWPVLSHRALKQRTQASRHQCTIGAWTFFKSKGRVGCGCGKEGAQKGEGRPYPPSLASLCEVSHLSQIPRFGRGWPDWKAGREDREIDQLWGWQGIAERKIAQIHLGHASVSRATGAASSGMKAAHSRAPPFAPRSLTGNAAGQIACPS